ncbi:LRR receptor-like serine threonine-protein kinase [Seminavis robusta]|uniref:LRR receptor-like serine threonine-protein kinase n=1 Tax=Seminavis robusta TaxID=568900 RepID=A0A9N8HN96_9STRA|nr:LRR receptor-like serine threonine-protein kinase [Seminavis robusta]|eukprot:Sro1064_g237230.1 LRR receptor-like serine threonine-protein kinase (405) ;mRNA; r:11325-12702
MQMEFDAPNLVQRFVLVLFYYQTTRHKPWRECNPPAAPHASAMSGFCYEPDLHSGEITSAIWGDLWLSASHECQWAGVTCETELSEEKTVVRLGISWNGLNGPLPWEVAHLSQLTRLTLEDNVLTGVLPPALFSNQAVLHLELLVLSSNEFTGTIPLRWFDNLDEGTAKLSSLWISSNRLTGTIPSEMGLLPLKELFLENNDLTGSLPMEIFQRASGVVNEFSDGILGGIHPGKAGLDRALEYLDLSHTGISGSLPSEVGLANSLTELYASGTNMNGTLPEELYGLGNLQVLAFNGCNFTGTISSSLGVLTRLSWLHLANNNFHGTIPHEIEALTMLSQLLVNGNQFTGSVPVSFCENRFVALQDVSKVVADCLPNEETGVPTIECAADCCTSCCDNTGVCLSN